MYWTDSVLIAICVLFLAGHTVAVETPANCGMSETTGCLNGNAYNYLDKKVCGNSLYDRHTVGCCHVATPFQYSTEFCCYGTVNPKSVGTCGKWTAELEDAAPACYDCSGRRLDQEGYESLVEDVEAEERELEQSEVANAAIKAPGADVDFSAALELSEDDLQQVQADAPEPALRRRLDSWPSPFPFDTVASGASPTPCTTIDDDYGCFNTYRFYYATEYICENYLLINSVYGCCDGIPYRFASQTCCYLDDAYVVKNANHWCACVSKTCVPTYAPTLPAAPTEAPVTRPTSEPTLTYKPTWESTVPPSVSPTHSQRPTVSVVTAATDLEKDVFKVNWLYGAAGFLVVTLGAIVFFQTRASKLIKERHDVALEIADTNFN